MLTPLDHLLAALVTLVAPPLVRIQYRRFLRRASVDGPAARRRAYLRTIVQQWIVAGVVVAIWLSEERGLDDLGLGMPQGGRFLVGFVLVAALACLLAYQLQALLREPSGLDAIRHKLAMIEPLLPHRDAEANLFMGVSVTAGVCEEILYRGFLIWYGAQFVPIWIAMTIASIVFGLAHSYQGVRGIVTTSIVGGVMAALYALSGSLWLPMFAHALVDLNSGFLARAAFGEGERAAGS